MVPKIGDFRLSRLFGTEQHNVHANSHRNIVSKSEIWHNYPYGLGKNTRTWSAAVEYTHIRTELTTLCHRATDQSASCTLRESQVRESPLASPPAGRGCLRPDRCAAPRSLPLGDGNTPACDASRRRVFQVLALVLAPSFTGSREERRTAAPPSRDWGEGQVTAHFLLANI